jgi:riboflavin kinase/FMN adenylyltransferase
MPSPLIITSKIQSGARRGRTLGFPTINQAPVKPTPRASHGVYCAFVKIDHQWWPGVAHLGPASTYGQTQVLCETFLLDTHDLPKTLTGKQATTILIHKLRPTKKFSSAQTLQRQIARDVAVAKKFFSL